MTTKQVLGIHNFIVIQQNHWFIYLIAYLFISLTQQSYKLPGMQLVIWFLLGLLPFAFYMIGKKVKVKVFGWGIYLLFLLGIYLIPVPHKVYTVIYLAVAAYYCVSSEFLGKSLQVYEKYKPTSLWIILSVSLVELLILQYNSFYEYQKGLLYLLIWNIMLFFMGSYINSYVKYLTLGRHAIGYMPVGSIMGKGLLCVVAFSTILSMLSIVVINVGELGNDLQHIIRFLCEVFFKIWEWIKALLQKIFKNREFEIQDLEQLVSQEDIFRQERDSNVIEVFLSILFGLVMLFAAFKLLKYIGILIAKLFSYQFSKEGEKLESQEIQDVVEKLNKKKRESFFEARTPQMRIRKRFRKKVLHEKRTITGEGGSDRMELYTAREASDILKKPVMAEVYEKARYSPYECTAEDVKLMKEACKN